MMHQTLYDILHGILGVEATALIYMVWKLLKAIRELKTEVVKRGTGTTKA
jgi:hypothetical protein